MFINIVLTSVYSHKQMKIHLDKAYGIFLQEKNAQEDAQENAQEVRFANVWIKWSMKGGVRLNLVEKNLGILKNFEEERIWQYEEIQNMNNALSKFRIEVDGIRKNTNKQLLENVDIQTHITEINRMINELEDKYGDNPNRRREIYG